MDTSAFQRQTDQPLYPKTLWNRPVTRHGAGRLLVAGGHTGEFSQPISLHGYAMAAGAGECRVVLPDSLTKTLGYNPGVEYVPSSPSGSMGRAALGSILHLSEDADVVLLGASLSNNSDTAIMAEQLIRRLERPSVLFEDALQALQLAPSLLTDRADHLIVLTMSELFKLAGRLQIPIKIRRDGGLVNKLEIIQSVVAETQCQWVVYGSELIVAAEGELTVTPIPFQLSRHSTVIAATLSVFWMQHQTAPLSGLTTGAYILARAAETAQGESFTTQSLSRGLERALSQTG